MSSSSGEWLLSSEQSNAAAPMPVDAEEEAFRIACEQSLKESGRSSAPPPPRGGQCSRWSELAPPVRARSQPAPSSASSARSLTTVESDARRLHRKNQLALEAAIAESQKEAAQTDRAARLAAEQTRAVLAARSNSSGSSNADPYAAFELLRRHRLPADAKGKGPASKQ